jgi:hypothetical protein
LSQGVKVGTENSKREKQNGGRREGSGRKPFVPTEKDRELAEKLAMWGVAEHQISPLIGDGIDVHTLRKYFSEEVQRGRSKASAGIGSTLYQKAMAGDIAALIWWSKAQMRWAEQPKVIELTGNISITEALAEARARIIDLADVEDATLSLSGDGCGDEYRMPLRTRVLAESSTDDAPADDDDQPRAEREVGE